MYTYKALQNEPPQIRLVTIEAAASSFQPLRLRLTRVELNASLEYHTLSYTWGSPGPRIPACWGDDTRELVYVDGQEFPVRLNLHSALLQLRNDYEATTGFWIDAICVDQSNVDERTAQVALMAQIYSGTQCNVTWLGPSDGETESAFGLINRLSTGELVELDHEYVSSATEEALAKATPVVEAGFGGEEAHTAWKALTSLFQRHYWQRAWIYQEVTLAPQTTMTCGAYKVSMFVIFNLGKTFLMLKEIFVSLQSTTQHKDLRDRLREFVVSWRPIVALQYLKTPWP